MNVSDQIIQVLDNLCEKFGLAIDWTSENVFPYLTTLCTKLVSYEIWSSVAYIVFCVLGIIACVITIKYFRGRIDDLEIFAILPFAIAGVAGLMLIAEIVTQTMDIIKCVTFPEMFVFEYVKDLLNTTH